MQIPRYINEGEIWLVDLEPTLGIELRKIRPAIVLRKFSKRHFVVLPITSKPKPDDTSFLLENISFLISPKNWVNISQIRVADVLRFKRKFGELPETKLLAIKIKTAEVLRLPPQRANAHNVD